MRDKLYELRGNVTDDVKLEIVYECVGIAKAMKNSFGMIYHYELYNDDNYLRTEKKIAKHTLNVLDALVGDTNDENVLEAKAYLKMLLKEES